MACFSQSLEGWKCWNLPPPTETSFTVEFLELNLQKGIMSKSHHPQSKPVSDTATETRSDPSLILFWHWGIKMIQGKHGKMSCVWFMLSRHLSVVFNPEGCSNPERQTPPTCNQHFNWTDIQPLPQCHSTHWSHIWWPHYFDIMKHSCHAALPHSSEVASNGHVISLLLFVWVMTCKILFLFD